MPATEQFDSRSGQSPVAWREWLKWMVSWLIYIVLALAFAWTAFVLIVALTR